MILAGRGLYVRDYRVLAEEGIETGSDHAVIEWRIMTKEEAGTQPPAYGWDIGGLMKDKEQLQKTRNAWMEKMTRLPTLSWDSTVRNLE